MSVDRKTIDGADVAAESVGEELQPLDYRELNVMAARCGECLFSPAALVDPEWRREIIEGCQNADNFFVCHRATIEGGLIVCCNGFFETQETQPIQLAKQLDMVRFVNPEDLPRLNPLGRKIVTPDIAFLLALHGKQIDDD
jgi:hypothetical protein